MTAPGAGGAAGRVDDRDLWSQVAALLGTHRVIIDRPAGSTHPRHDWMIYPLDYGYLDGTSAVDGGGVDVFLGSADRRTLDAAAVTFDPYKHDVEVKLLAGCTPDEVRTVAEFWDRTGTVHSFVLRRDAADRTAGVTA